ncbi:MAG: T9SS type A sorting domain-containing protein [Bacteroidales bacterium]|nr:T9SS type A sorting domain-containing protein [Bacteroidales bacterium]
MKKFLHQKTFAVIMLTIFSLIMTMSATAQQKTISFDTDYERANHFTFDKTASIISLEQQQTKTYISGDANVDILFEGLLYANDISEDGKIVIFTPFGSPAVYWAEDGTSSYIDGNVYNVTNSGIVIGTFVIPELNSELNVSVAGKWDINTQEWTFLGINPDAPNVFSNSYNSGWGQSNDGSKIVGMQWQDDWSVFAYEWSEDGGYNNIGINLPEGSRASGISGNGLVTYGWTTLDWGGRTPIIWKNGLPTLLNPDDVGEVYSASDDGSIVAGNTSDSFGDDSFYWTESEGMVRFGDSETLPSLVLNDGTIFGFYGMNPYERIAFHRNVDGTMGSFNDYAESRGMTDAQSWTFYTITDATTDGNIFIGCGMNPFGQVVGFRITFNDMNEAYQLTLEAYPAEGAELLGSGEYEAGSEVGVIAIPNEDYTFINWTDEDGTIVSTDSLFTYTMPENAMTLTAHFDFYDGIGDVNASQIQIYPNPASQLIHINGVSENSTLQLFDMNGQLILQLESPKTNNIISIDNMKNGLYILQISNQKGNRYEKLQIIQ